MKRYMLAVVLIALLFPATAFAQCSGGSCRTPIKTAISTAKSLPGGVVRRVRDVRRGLFQNIRERAQARRAARRAR